MNRQSLSLVSWVAPQILIAATVFFAAGSIARHDGNQDFHRQAEIWISYAMDPELRMQEITVAVHGGDVVLIGTVASSLDRKLAERLARSVRGIKRVDNRLEIDVGNARQPLKFQTAFALAVA